MAPIKYTSILVTLLLSFLGRSQNNNLFFGDGRQAMYLSINPEFLAVNFDQALTQNNDGWHVNTGYQINLGLWMGIPLELNYLIPVGNMSNHLSMGVGGAYLWSSTDRKYEYWYGPNLGLRVQPEQADLFLKVNMHIARSHYFNADEIKIKMKFIPSFGLGITF